MPDFKLMVCNTNSHGHTDYNMPISVHMGTDYRTSYQHSHGWIPPFPDEFDTRVPKKYTRPKDLNLKGMYESTYTNQFYARACSKSPDQSPKPSECYKMKYMTTFEHRLFSDPPPPLECHTSEMRAAYKTKERVDNNRTVFPPIPYKLCPIRAFGRDEQPAADPAKPGVARRMDIYVSTTRGDYVAHDEKVQRGIACKNIVTFYDATGVPRGGKGYGPKHDTKIERLVDVKKPEPSSIRGNIMQNIPNRAFKSEYNENYQQQTRSPLEPYKELLAVAEYPSYTRISPWQTLAAPGMYCTETCHIGTGYPINAIIDYNIQHRKVTSRYERAKVPTA